MELPILNCDGCGVCCEEQGLPPTYTQPEHLSFLPKDLRDQLAEGLAEERAAGATRNQRGLPCTWFDTATHRCRHYELRPDVCREAEVGGPSCLFWRERRLGRGRSSEEPRP
jgi:Fe-S-cluster containining protein